MAERAVEAQSEPAEEHEGKGPLRQCAVSRSERPIAELIRFVATPDGSVVPDLASRLPGRGVWLTCDKDTVAQAIRANAFARGLKRAVKAPADLPDQVEGLLLARALSALSIANKAGLVVAGYAQVEALLGKERPAALLHGSDAAAGGKEKLDRRLATICRETGRRAPVLNAFTIEQMSLAIGRANVVHAALKQGGASEKFLSEAGRVARFRLGRAERECAQPAGSSPQDINDAANQSGVDGKTHE